MKIVVLDGHTTNPGDLNWDDFNEFGEVTVYDRTPPELVVERIGDAEIAISNKTPMPREHFEACKSLKYLGVIATGYNIIDVVAAKEMGITVTNIPTYSTSAVAQFTMALLLEVCHQVGAHSESVKAGDWANCKDFCYWKSPLMELAGKTLGVIGFGRIGQEVAKLAKAFGMNVIAYGPRYKSEPGASVPSVSLDELYARSDVISLNCPLTDETKGIINKDSIAKMKDGVIILNSSRGALIVEQDLRDALDSGKVAHAAVDVLSVEPPSAGNPLIGAKNCIITPHIAWAPIETRKRLLKLAVENIRAFLEGNPQNVVSK